jgi:adenine/guanine phosphoribosyltransferase-like PRPP-binding protein
MVETARRHTAVRVAACWLPSGPTVTEEYVTEYSTDKIQMHVGAVKEGQRVLLVDDLIATGGTLRAGINLIGGGAGRGADIDKLSVCNTVHGQRCL